MTARVGDVIDGRFQLLSPLGSGGMGTVWRARDLALQREVALKEVRAGDDADEVPGVTQLRVQREAQALARLSHPNVVSIHHFIEQDPHPWLVMELVQGQSLDAVLRANGPLSPAQAATIGRDVNRALSAAHQAGVHHRDVKPANVILRPDGSAVLTDFGIALLAGDTHLTQSGQVIGSVEFMAPERLRGAPDIVESDLYSLGMLMLVTTDGHNPLRRSSPIATLTAVLHEPRPTPQHAGNLTPLISQLLHPDPDQRPSIAQIEATLAALGGTSPTAHLPPSLHDAPTTQVPASSAATTVGVSASPSMGQPPERSVPTRTETERRPSRRLPLIAALCAALIAGGLGVGYVLQDRRDSTSQAGASASPSTTPPHRVATSQSGSAPNPTSSTPARSDQDGASSARARAAPVTRTPPREQASSAPDVATDEPSSTRPSEDVQPEDGAVRTPGNDSWIAQLASVPISGGTAARDARLRQIRRAFPDAAAFPSSQYASLRSGYWVIWSGPFADGGSALTACRNAGLTGRDSCVGRLVSTDAGDRKYICTRHGSSGCTRD